MYLFISNQKQPSWFSEGLHVDAFLVAWKELTAFSTSENTALRFSNRRKEPAARWEACEGTHLLASTGRCLVNRRQKEGQSRERKQPAVSHFLIQIHLARNEMHINLVFLSALSEPVKTNTEKQTWTLKALSSKLFSTLRSPQIIKTMRKWKFYWQWWHRTKTDTN